MAKALTDQAIQKLSAPDARREIPDGLVTGLYLVLQPSGKRSWSVRYRAGGVPRKVTLGAYPALPLAAARSAAKATLLKVAEGADPAVDKRIRKAAATSKINAFDSVARRYIADHKRRGNKTWREVARQLGLVPGKGELGTAPSEDPQDFEVVKGGLTHRWGSRTLDSITSDELLVELDKQAKVQANRFLATLKTLWKFALSPRVKAATSNPVAVLERPAEESSRDRVLTDLELRAVWKAADKMSHPWNSLTRMLILSGQRRDEVARMPWAEIDLGAKVWTIAPERAKNGNAHKLHLSAPALAELISIGRNGPFVFSRNGTVPVADYTDAKAKLDDLADVTAWWFHDLRRTMATRLGQIGVPIEVVEGVLNHTSGSRGGLVGVYQRGDLEPQRYRALHAWGRYVEFIVSDRLFDLWRDRLAGAENEFDARLEMYDAILAGGARWVTFVHGLEGSNVVPLRRPSP